MADYEMNLSNLRPPDKKPKEKQPRTPVFGLASRTVGPNARPQMPRKKAKGKR